MRLRLRAVSDLAPDGWIAPPETAPLGSLHSIDPDRNPFGPFFSASSNDDLDDDDEPEIRGWRTIPRLLGLPPCRGLHCLIRMLWIALLLVCVVVFLVKSL